jgi:hypothetical protein
MKKKIQNTGISIKLSLIILCITLPATFYSIYCCGGGVIPYIPTQSGASGNTTSGSFFLVEKGVSGEMFDVSRLQPLFRNIVSSGNERTIHKNKEKLLEMNKAAMAKDSTLIKNSVHGRAMSDSVLPVLNLHRLH